MPATKQYMGQSMKRVEDPRLIKGIASYVDDILLPGMLHASFVRSPYAHARINRINTDSARAAPGVVGVFTGTEGNDKCGFVHSASEIPDLKSPKHTVLSCARA